MMLCLFFPGYVGLVLIVFCCLASGYNGTRLGKCWNMLLERYPEEYATGHCRYPYPAIAQKAMGGIMRSVHSYHFETSLG